jgi:hypothetical protein
MKHRRSLLLSIWGIAIGIILWISGAVVGGNFGMIYHEGSWFSADLGLGLVWAAIIILILGAFGIGTTFLREFLDRDQKTAKSPPSS